MKPVALHAGMTQVVVSLALFRVAQHLVCLGCLLEHGFSLRIIRVAVRVILKGHLTVSFFNLFLACFPGDPQHLVVIPFISHT